MSDWMPEGFVNCEQCKGAHRPAPGVCIWKLSKDATFVLDAGLSTLSDHTIGWVLRELNVKEDYRYVSTPEQRRAYLLAGHALKRGEGWREFADDGAEWVTKADLPKDVLLIETSGSFGLIKALAVP